MNPIKKAGTKILLDKERIISFNFNTLIGIEEKYGSVEKGLGNLENPKMKDIRYLLYLALKDNDKDLTEEKVGEMIALHRVDEVVEALTNAIEKSFPEADEEEKN